MYWYRLISISMILLHVPIEPSLCKQPTLCSNLWLIFNLLSYKMYIIIVITWINLKWMNDLFFFACNLTLSGSQSWSPKMMMKPKSLPLETFYSEMVAYVYCLTPYCFPNFHHLYPHTFTWNSFVIYIL